MTDQRQQNDDDCPFSYKPGEEPPVVEHKVVGKCADCGDDAFTTDGVTMRCWPCAYSAASW